MAIHIKGKGVVSGETAKEDKPKRAKTATGKFKADDAVTVGYNEAWVGGEAPKPKKKKRKSSKS